MLKNVVRFTHSVDGKDGLFFIDYDTPIPSAKEMLCQFLTQLGNIEKDVLAREEARKAQEKINIESPQEPVPDHCVKEESNEETVS